MNIHETNPKSPAAMTPPTRPLRQRFRDAARTEILEAAERVFVRDGLVAARIDGIAAEAGVSVGTLYNLFKDRGGIVEALMEWRHGDFQECLHAALDAHANAAFEPRLRAFVGALFTQFQQRWAFLRVIKQAEFAPDSAGCGHGPLKSREAFQQMFAQIGGLIQQGVDEGRIADSDAELALTAFMGLLRAAVDVPLLLDRPAFETTADQVVDLFLYGVTRRTSGV